MTGTLPTAPASAPAAPADAVDRLRATFASGRTRDLDWRRGQLRGIERMLAEQEDALVDALAADLGRPRVDSFLVDIAPSAAEAAYARKHLGRWARAHRTLLPLSVMPGSAHYQYEPLGTVLVIGPWNYPVYLVLGPLVAALAAGNCAVLKPSEHTPATSAALAELLPRYLDADAVTVVQGGPEETQALLARGFDHCFFTGSPEVGAKVMAGAAPTLTPVTLELGGKSPVYVAADADVAVAAKRIAWTKLVNSGQTCVAPDYVLVDEAVRDELVAGITAAVGDMRAGQPPLRLIDDRQTARLASLLDDHGGEVVLGGHFDPATSTGEPTVVVDPASSSRLMTEEIFGPILPVVTVAGVDAAVERVNSGPKPLAAYVFSRSKDTAAAVRDGVASGATVVNHLMFHVLVPQLPFGGVGRSGMGAYHGRWGFETFSHRKAVLTKGTRPDPSVIYPPYSRAAERLLRRIF